jgi:hypothetical protein
MKGTEEPIIQRIGSIHHTLRNGEKGILVINEFGKGMFIPAGSELLIKSPDGLDEIQLENITQKSSLEKYLKGKEILVDRHGVYVSFKPIFMKFMISFGQAVRFSKGPFEWRGFYRLYDEATKWINVINKTVELYQETHKITLEEAEVGIAEFLSRLELTAKRPEYIRLWWKESGLVETEKGQLSIYRVEHPRLLSDIKAIFDGINRLFPESRLTHLDAERTYSASMALQATRRSLLKGRITDLNRYLVEKFSKKLKNVVDASDSFKVSRVYDVNIIKEVEPFRVIDDYAQYIKNI